MGAYNKPYVENMDSLTRNYIKSLEDTIDRQQISVEKFTDVIKKLDSLNLNISIQDASNLINPYSFVKWLDSSQYWKKTESLEDYQYTKCVYKYHAEDRFIVIFVPPKKDLTDPKFTRSVTDAFSEVARLCKTISIYKTKNTECRKMSMGIITLLIEILEQEE